MNKYLIPFVSTIVFCFVSLSNQRYYAADGKCYEGTGTPVDKKVKNAKKDLQTGSDPVIIAAINMLKKR